MGKVKGVGKLQSQFNSLRNEDYTEALLKGGEVLKGKSETNAPVDKGDLKASHKLRVTFKNNIELIVKVLYSSIVEYRQPYLRPAIDHNEALISRATGEGVQEIIKRKI